MTDAMRHHHQGGQGGPLWGPDNFWYDKHKPGRQVAAERGQRHRELNTPSDTAAELNVRLRVKKNHRGHRLIDKNQTWPEHYFPPGDVTSRSLPAHGMFDGKSREEIPWFPVQQTPRYPDNWREVGRDVGREQHSVGRGGAVYRPESRSNVSTLAPADQHYRHPAHSAEPDMSQMIPHTSSLIRPRPNTQDLNPNLNTSHMPSFQSEEDEVFPRHPDHSSTHQSHPRSGISHHTPGLPRHSSLKPSLTTYLLDGQPAPPPVLQGLADISSVLEPPSQTHSYLTPPSPAPRALTSTLPSGSFSPSTHPIFGADGSVSNIPGYYVTSADNQHATMVTPRQPHRQYSDNDSSNASSGRPLGYTRDQLHGVVQRLRESRPNYSGSRSTLHDSQTLQHSHSSTQNLTPRNQDMSFSERGRQTYRATPTTTQRSHSEGRALPSFHDYQNIPAQHQQSVVFSSPDLSRPYTNNPRHSSHPDLYRHHADPPPPLPPSRNAFTPNPTSWDQYPLPPSQSRTHEPLPYNVLESKPPRVTSRPPVLRTPHSPIISPHLDSLSRSSGIGSRNTSHSTSHSTVASHPRHSSSGYSGKTSASLSPPHDPDLSDLSGGHRRDVSADENYEFDSINALEHDIMDDLQRYSRFINQQSQPSATTTGQSVVNPHASRSSLVRESGRTNRYPESDQSQRFEKLREEFKQYRQLKLQPWGHPSSVGHIAPPPTASSALPLGANGEPLYPMDSDML